MESGFQEGFRIHFEGARDHSMARNLYSVKGLEHVVHQRLIRLGKVELLVRSIIFPCL